MSENLKLRLDPMSGEANQDGLPRPPDALTLGDSPQIDEAESQMRKALGLLGDTPRHRSDGDRMEQPSRLGDRFNAGLHRRRFVQDGDIPVTVLRRDQGHEAPVHRGTAQAPAPTSSRLQRTEAALAAETAARERAERLLAETQAVVRDLQTKIGHAELTKNEAVEALRREREVVVQLRTEAAAWETRVQEASEQVRLTTQNLQTSEARVTDERQARNAAEKALRAVELDRDAARQILHNASSEPPAPARVIGPTRRRAEPMPGAHGTAELAVAAAGTASRRARPNQPPTQEPEPVKWWLNTKSAGKKR